MKNYQVLGRVASVHAGLVKLTADQARRRKHLLKPRGDGVYEVLAPIQFKHNEQFGYDGEFPKAMATEVMTPEEIKTQAETRAKEEKKSKAKATAEAAAKKKAADDEAAAKARTLEEAIQAADKVIAGVKDALKKAGDKIDPVVKATIEQTIEDMAIFAEDQDADGLKAATLALSEQAQALKVK